jgi:hypothetical protein
MRYLRSALAVMLAALALLGAGAMPNGVAAQEPETAVQPTQGPAGTTFSFFARGLDNNAEFAFWATAPNGEVLGSEEYRTRSFGDRADWTWTSPGDAPSGVWAMVIQPRDKEEDDDEEKEENRRKAKTIQFVIGDGSAPAPAPAPNDPAPAPSSDQGAVQPAVGAPGTQFAFFATGFDGSERVGFWVNGPDGTVIDDSDGNTTANSDGRADWRYTAPGDAAPGVYTMVARGVESDVERVIVFQIQ